MPGIALVASKGIRAAILAGILTIGCSSRGVADSFVDVLARADHVRIEQEQRTKLPSFAAGSAVAAVEQERQRSEEQAVLLDAVECYMDVLLAAARVDLYGQYLDLVQSNLDLAADQSKSAKPSSPDPILDAARLKSWQDEIRSAEQSARGQLKNAVTRYQDMFGIRPTVLEPGAPASSGLPHSLAEASRIAQEENPGVRGASLAMSSVAGATFEGKAVFPPTDWAARTNFWKLDAPFYDSRRMYVGSAARDLLRKFRKAELDVARGNARETVVAAWNAYVAAEAGIEASNVEIAAAKASLKRRSDVRREDQKDRGTVEAWGRLLEARLALIRAQRDRIVAGYALLAAVGRLSSNILHLQKPATSDPARPLLARRSTIQ